MRVELVYIDSCYWGEGCTALLWLLFEVCQSGGCRYRWLTEHAAPAAGCGMSAVGVKAV